MDNNENDDKSTLTGQKRQKLKSSELFGGKAVLIILSENFFGKSFVINKSVMTIGRNNDCDISLNDPLISSHHCSIEIHEDGKYYIEDIGSTNATFINRKKLKKKIDLIYGDRIVIGKTILRFFLKEDVSDG
ncbi:MAG: FHA domain-containing protein [Spirochaetales bacterium]|nr:FHA domain-containing protein [Spirochaetales bacterium]